MDISLNDGKYHLHFVKKDGSIEVCRFGLMWKVLEKDDVTIALMEKIIQLETELAKTKELIKT